MKNLFALCLLVVATVTISAKTIKEFVVTTQPQMSCQNCENKIKKSLRFEKGVTNIKTDLENQVVVVTYDADKTNETNLAQAFAKIDYQVAPTTKAGGAPAAKACSKDGKACDGKSCSKDKANAAKKDCCKDKAEKKCDGKCKDAAKDKACAKDGKGCDGKSCSKEGKACDGKSCAKDKASAEKKACAKDGKCKHEAKDAKCKDAKCKEGNCKDCPKKGTADCCKNKK